LLDKLGAITPGQAIEISTLFGDAPSLQNISMYQSSLTTNSFNNTHDSSAAEFSFTLRQSIKSSMS
jgi:hypothetical protein